MRENCGDLLPKFTDEEKALIKGSSDFQGVNFYTASYVSAQKRGTPGSGWYVDRNASNSATAPNGTQIGVQADSPWLYIVPWGLHKMLNWIGNRYGSSVQMVVTENGMDVVAENAKPLADALHDTDRIAYLDSYIAAMGQSVQDGYNVTGYFVWSLMDNYEVRIATHTHTHTHTHTEQRNSEACILTQYICTHSPTRERAGTGAYIQLVHHHCLSACVLHIP